MFILSEFEPILILHSSKVDSMFFSVLFVNVAGLFLVNIYFMYLEEIRLDIDKF